MSQLLSRQLEYFIAVYRHRDLNQAARSIPITYQGLKKSITKLERDLQVPLFIQNEDGILESTHAADLLYDMALRWVQDEAQLETLLYEHEPNTEEVIELCAATGVVAFLGYDLTREFNKTHPNIHLEVTEFFDAEIDNLLLQGKYDLGIVTAPFHSELPMEKLATNGCIAWINDKDPLSENETLTMADLAGKHVMIPNRMVKAHRFFQEAFQSRGIEPSTIETGSDPYAAYYFAKENLGVGIGVQGTPHYGGPSDHVKALVIEDGYPYEFGISWRQGHALSEAEATVMTFLRKRANRKRR